MRRSSRSCGLPLAVAGATGVWPLAGAWPSAGTSDAPTDPATKSRRFIGPPRRAGRSSLFRVTRKSTCRYETDLSVALPDLDPQACRARATSHRGTLRGVTSSVVTAWGGRTCGGRRAGRAERALQHHHRMSAFEHRTDLLPFA